MDFPHESSPPLTHEIESAVRIKLSGSAFRLLGVARHATCKKLSPTRVSKFQSTCVIHLAYAFMSFNYFISVVFF